MYGFEGEVKSKYLFILRQFFACQYASYIFCALCAAVGFCVVGLRVRFFMLDKLCVCFAHMQQGF